MFKQVFEYLHFLVQLVLLQVLSVLFLFVFNFNLFLAFSAVLGGVRLVTQDARVLVREPWRVHRALVCIHIWLNALSELRLALFGGAKV